MIAMISARIQELAREHHQAFAAVLLTRQAHEEAQKVERMLWGQLNEMQRLLGEMAKNAANGTDGTTAQPSGLGAGRSHAGPDHPGDRGAVEGAASVPGEQGAPAGEEH